MEHNGDINATNDHSMVTLVIMSMIMMAVFQTYGGKITGADVLEEQSQNTYVAEDGDSVIINSQMRSTVNKTYPESIYDK